MRSRRACALGQGVLVAGAAALVLACSDSGHKIGDARDASADSSVDHAPGSGGAAGAGGAAGGSGGAVGSGGAAGSGGKVGSGGAAGSGGMVGSGGVVGSGGSIDASADASALERCLATGGTQVTLLCCNAVTDYPNGCLTGQCGCAPASSHNVAGCSCPSGKCFDPSQGCITGP